MSAGWLINSFRSTYNHITGYNVPSCLFIQIRDYAARKGTREKARKKKVKFVVEKVGFIPHNARAKKKLKTPVLQTSMAKFENSGQTEAIDDVWIVKYHKPPVYSFKEAIELHRETHHPTMYNEPNAPVNVFIDINMQREKQTKFLDKFTRLLEIPHPFENHEERAILAFCKSEEEQDSAKKAGANFVGGIDLIKQIQGGNFPYKEYKYIVAHPDILPDLLLIRGLLKRRFPNMRQGNLGTDMGSLVAKFRQGIEYTVNPVENSKNFGETSITFGTLDMDTKHLEENMIAVINDIQEMKPKRDGSFILRVQIMSPPTSEAFRIYLESYLPSESAKEVEEDDNTSAVITMH